MTQVSDEEVHWGSRDPAWDGVWARTLSVLGRQVRVVGHPVDADSTGPAPFPQLFVHGLGGSARNWLEVLAPLSRFGETLAVDLPGFGDTPIPEGGSARVRANAGCVLALLDTLGWERVVLYGNSMGGLIATLVASRHPQRIERLVLVNPALPAPRRAMFKLPLPVIARVVPTAIPGLGRLFVEAGFRRKSAEELVDDALAAVLGQTARVRPAYREVLVDNMRRAKSEAWRRAALCEAASSLVGMITEATELNRAVDRVQAPTLLLWGDADRLVTTYVIEGLLERRPDWEHHIFAGVGHAPMLEASDAFVSIVGDWHERVAHGRPATPPSSTPEG